MISHYSFAQNERVLLDKLIIEDQQYVFDLLKQTDDQNITKYIVNIKYSENDYVFELDTLMKDSAFYIVIADSIINKVPPIKSFSSSEKERVKQELYGQIKKLVFLSLLPSIKEDYSKILTLYETDFAVGTQNFSLSLREIELLNDRTYYFELTKGDEKRSFKMSKLKPDQQRIKVFKNYLKDRIASLNQSTEALISQLDLKKIQVIADSVNSVYRLNNLSQSEKKIITEILEKTEKHSNYDKFQVLNDFKKLSDGFLNHSRNDDFEWLKNEINKTEILNEANIESEQEAISNLVSQLLFNAYLSTVSATIGTPKIGRLFVSPKVKVYQYHMAKECTDDLYCPTPPDNIKPLKVHKLQVKKVGIKAVEIEFEYGQIANIIVKTEDLDENSLPIHFQNRIPISYSTKADVSRDLYGLKIVEGVRLFRVGANKHKEYVLFEDLLFDDYNPQNGTENYSPGDTVLTIYPNSPAKLVYKENVVDILQAKVFSDFFGWNGESANGIIQTEISRKFQLLTKSKQYRRYKYVNAINYLIPRLHLMRLGEQDKKLKLTSNIDEKIYSVSTLDLFRYANFTFGGDLNLIYLRGNKVQTDLAFDFGLYFSQINKNSIEVDNPIGLEDQLTEINAVNLQLKIIFEYDPHPQFGFRFMYNPMFHTIFNQLVKQTDGTPNNIYNNVIALNRFSKDRIKEFGEVLIHKFEFLAHAKIREESEGEFFFRYSNSMYQKDLNQNFNQLQLGYAFNLFSNKDGQKVAVPKIF